MNLPLLLASPVVVLLCKWTFLLALGWAVHWTIRHRQARWRLILWRSILSFSLTLPVLQFCKVPGINIPIRMDAGDMTSSDSPFRLDDVNPIQSGPSVMLKPVRSQTVIYLPSDRAKVHPITVTRRSVSWVGVLLAIWAIGAVLGVFRLIRLQRRLSHLRKNSRPIPQLNPQVIQIRDRLKVYREIEVKATEAVRSPFVCGVWKPALILPKTLLQQLSAIEMSALLNHELAHLRENHLMWCIAWRWMKAVCWFHPLVWRIPAAHNLACEQEADQIASGQLEDRHSYGQMLAQLALRVLAVPAVGTQLTLNGSSQIAQRLNHLGKRRLGAWNWKYSVAGFGLAGVLFLLTAGCHFSQSNPVGPTASETIEFKKVLVVVQDEAGKPVEGATILPDGFRVKGLHAADAYGWNKKLFGPPEKVITGHDGKAYVKYPIMGIPEEKQLTGVVVFSVSHPDFSTVRPQEYSVDGPNKPIRLTNGIELEVSGYVGSDHQPVTDLVPNLNEEIIHKEDWQKEANGVYAFHKLSLGGHLVQLMGRLPSGEIVFSESFAFDAVKGKKNSFSLEMKPGIRVEGRVDDQVPRPVKNGRILISVRAKEFPAWNNYADVDDILKKYPNVHPWKTYRPIAEDGSFVFEAVPPGGLDVIVHGDGFVSKSGGDFSQRSKSGLVKVPGFALPQPFALEAPTTKIEVVTEPTATLELTAKTRGGKPVEGAAVYVNPNVVRMGGIFGNMGKSSEEPFRTLPPLPNIQYSATTGKNGVAVIRNIPATERAMDVYHPQFQVPLQEPKGWRDRHLRITCAPGQTNKIALTLEPKGEDYLGSN